MPSRSAVLIVTAFAAVLVACESPRPAPPSRPANISSAGSVDQQQRELEVRMDQALRAGRLSRDDHHILKSQADEIRRDERRFMQNGELSSAEKASLNVRLDNLSRELDRRTELSRR